jgi:hypothetical protein
VSISPGLEARHVAGRQAVVNATTGLAPYLTSRQRALVRNAGLFNVE